ncbi:hypothetical protein Tco_1403944 [Tanacetum coccineum]
MTLSSTNQAWRRPNDRSVARKIQADGMQRRKKEFEELKSNSPKPKTTNLRKTYFSCSLESKSNDSVSSPKKSQGYKNLLQKLKSEQEAQDKESLECTPHDTELQVIDSPMESISSSQANNH